MKKNAWQGALSVLMAGIGLGLLRGYEAGLILGGVLLFIDYILSDYPRTKK
jgi:hypothetical protein